MEQATVQSALADLALGPFRYYEQISSTNDEAARWAGEGSPDLALVIANEQTAGRGRKGRKWFTPADSALAFSLVLKELPPHTKAAEIQQVVAHLTALGALAVSQALIENYNLTAKIKWPNDVLLNRRKVAGVLAEAHWYGEILDAVILGIGVNVSKHSVPPDAQVLFPATSVEDALGSPPDRLELLKAILQSLLEWRTQLGMPAFQRAWQERLALRNEWVRIISQSEHDSPVTLEGELLGLDSKGGLQVRAATGEIHTFYTGEVSLRPVDATR